MVHAVYDRELSLWRATSTEKGDGWHPLLDRMGYMHALPTQSKRMLCFAPEEAAWLQDAGHLALDEPIASVLQSHWTAVERDMWPCRWAVYNQLRSSGWYLLPHRAHVTRQMTHSVPHQSVFRCGAPCRSTPQLSDTLQATLTRWTGWLQTYTYHVWRGLLYRLLLFPLFRTAHCSFLVVSRGILKEDIRTMASSMAVPPVQTTALVRVLLSTLSTLRSLSAQWGVQTDRPWSTLCRGRRLAFHHTNAIHRSVVLVGTLCGAHAAQNGGCARRHGRLFIDCTSHTLIYLEDTIA